jgi:hypothetical protein
MGGIGLLGRESGMTVRRAIVDIHERIYSEDMQEDWTEQRIQGFDATDLLIEMFGESGEEVASFAYEPHEFGRIGELLARDPGIDFRAELDPSFDILDFLQEGLTQDSSDEDIVAAWRAWRESVVASNVGDQWSRRRWEQRAGEMDSWLMETGITSEALVPIMRSLSSSPAAMAALVDALRGWQGDPIVGLRTTQTLVEALQAPNSGS